MTKTTGAALIERFQNLFDRERELMRAGRAHEAVDLIDEKLEALKALEEAISGQGEAGATPMTSRELETIKTMAAGMETHFIAVRNGMKNLIQRLDGRGEAAVGSYGRDGQRITFRDASGGYSKSV